MDDDEKSPTIWDMLARSRDIRVRNRGDGTIEFRGVCELSEPVNYITATITIRDDDAEAKP